MRYTHNEKPAFLVRYAARVAEQCARDKANAERERDAMKRQAQRYARASFWRDSVYLTDFFNARSWGGEIMDGRGMSDIQEAFWEANIDYGWHDGREAFEWDYRGGDALDLFRYLCPDAPIVAERIASIKSDLARATSDAERSDYEAKFYDWVQRHIDHYADESGLRWCLLDSDGKPTAHWCEAERVGFACTRAEYLKPDAPWWNEWNASMTRAARLEEAENLLGDWLRETVTEDAKRTGAPDDFDPRGYGIADSDDWPGMFEDCSEARDAWRSEVKTMRARLRAMIRARAPLHERARLVQSVYGEPGSIIEGDDA